MDQSNPGVLVEQLQTLVEGRVDVWCARNGLKTLDSGNGKYVVERGLIRCHVRKETPIQILYSQGTSQLAVGRV